jgi:AraC-like DNA-binding protein
MDPHPDAVTAHVPFNSAVIAPHVLRYLHVEARDRGHDLEPALRHAGLTLSALESGQFRVSYRQGTSVISSALRALDDPLLGLAVGRRQHAASWGILGLALMTAADLRSGIEVGLRYQQAAGALVRWRLTGAASRGVALVATMRDGSADPALERFLVDEAFSSVLAVARDAIGPGIAPREVRVRHAAPASAAERAAYQDALTVTPRFASTVNEFVFTASDLARVPQRQDPWVHAEARAVIDAAIPAARERQELIEGIETAVAHALPRVPALREHAGRLWISERTLRRRLAASGATYEAIVDGVRSAMVRQLLTGSSRCLDEIAHAVGFSDARTLRRAVIRWTGLTPSAIRRLAS